jgi:hypothetical protein
VGEGKGEGGVSCASAGEAPRDGEGFSEVAASRVADAPSSDRRAHRPELGPGVSVKRTLSAEKDPPSMVRCRTSNGSTR